MKSHDFFNMNVLIKKRNSNIVIWQGADPSIKELQGQLNTAFGDQWRFQRTVLAPTFSSGKMRMMNEDIQKCCEQLVDSLRDMSKESGGKVNLRSVFCCYTLDVIARTAFGIDINSQKDPNSDFVKYAKMGIGLENTFTLPSFIIGNKTTYTSILTITLQLHKIGNPENQKPKAYKIRIKQEPKQTNKNLHHMKRSELPI
ncbi:hypothetical protein FSP39_014622 [Pinctada imbricata]|uniref:Cytochrome P450 n=1 Tax=Pinctada imbricata TaxID=66713 RepID=A0AA88XUX5_PINIB|nr:hypothetical protein FSP39_014622 [Pinctada imbricata]